jgi:uncharacterized protein YggE
MVSASFPPNNNFDHVDIKQYQELLFAITIMVLTVLIGMTIIISQYNILFAQNTAVNDIGNKTTGITGLNSTIYSFGSAFARLQPDRVFASIGVETTEKTANAALTENSELMNRIVSELRNKGLMQNETRTSSFNIYPVYNDTGYGTRLNVSGFTATNFIQIESSKLDNVSEWIDTAVASGANSINSIDFTVSNNRLEDAKNNLITQAIANAKQKADIAASAVGSKVIGAKSIILEGFNTVPPSPPEPILSRQNTYAQDAATLASTPILPGEQEISTSVSVVFSMR